MDFLFLLILVALFIPILLGLRRQKREAEKTATMQDSLKIGDQVVTTSGLWGTVVELDEDTVDLEIAEDVVTTWLRLAIREVREPADEIADETVDDTPADPAEETPEQTETRLTKD
ncbi:preprotein translocase subunit YajC [Nocardia puris]|uniref:Preprotein translocase subunit YajC n=1 Tax=Nocardia puris TaxID=208602 RepID=A0A366E4J0_9NOCA|nr:preprotein translocase subunit YajC [Nocardia puris]MBF6212865.1 preprotein translocase subunit YajC [Nocardia puris]MBF6367799.1 preprotein translocase subunit YajC [Nocardia puris]MBF6461451.1 preprotein translocase subunit YajC [Nocardia puris]RBO96308.1 preprotein translocase subunit YajC [Nocardia puris]